MKRWIAPLTAAVLGLSLATSSFAAPAGAAPPQPGQKAQKGQKGTQGRRGGGGYKRLEAALAKLNLSAEQKTKVDKLVTQAKADAKKLRESQGTPDEKRAKRREAMKSFRQQLNAILTPAQQAQLREAMPKRGNGPRNGKNAKNANAKTTKP